MINVRLVYIITVTGVENLKFENYRNKFEFWHFAADGL